jgi:hypothetical protein
MVPCRLICSTTDLHAIHQPAASSSRQQDIRRRQRAGHEHMSIPRDPLHPQNPLTPPRLNSYGPDDPTFVLHPLADPGSDREAHADDPTLADATDATDATAITDPALPQLPLLPGPCPLFPLALPFTRATTAHDQPRLRTLHSRQVAIPLAGVGLFLAVVLVVSALLVRPLVALLLPAPSSAGQPVTARTPTPLPTVTPSPSPTATPPPSAVATFVALDTSTQGNWQGVYGSAGYVLAGDTQQLPAAIQVTPSSDTAAYMWAASTDDARALVKPENPADRIAACWYAPTSFTLDIAITDGHTYQLALYLLDWDQSQRVETVSVLDPASGVALDTRPASAFDTGIYFVWQVSGHVTLQLTNAAGSPNAVVSALFFAPA